jgi:hypothetical protein
VRNNRVLAQFLYPSRRPDLRWRIKMVEEAVSGTRVRSGVVAKYIGWTLNDGVRIEAPQGDQQYAVPLLWDESTDGMSTGIPREYGCWA